LDYFDYNRTVLREQYLPGPIAYFDVASNISQALVLGSLTTKSLDSPLPLQTPQKKTKGNNGEYTGPDPRQGPPRCPSQL
jgi:hypothetical protein